MLGALLSGGVSLLSGLLGGMSAKSQAKKEEAAIREANRIASENAARMNVEVRARADAAALVPHQTARGVDMDAFMAAAENYGFNPLTFLRSGALSSFEWACETGHGAMQAAEAGQYIPQLAPVIAQTKVPGMGEIFGNALTSGANQYLADVNQQNQFQHEVSMAMLRGTLRGGGGSFPSVPQSFKRSETSAKKNGVTIWDLGIGETLVDGVIASKMYLPMVDNSAAGGGRIAWVIRPDFPDTEQAAAAGIYAGAAAVEREGDLLRGVFGDGRFPAIERRGLPDIPRFGGGRF